MLDNPDNRIDQHTGVRSGKHTPLRSEGHAEVHSECSRVRRRPAYRPVETDRQVCLNEVSFEDSVVTLEAPAVVHEGRRSPSRVIYVERQSSSRPPAVS